jgi:hypothetical protein
MNDTRSGKPELSQVVNCTVICYAWRSFPWFLSVDFKDCTMVEGERGLVGVLRPDEGTVRSREMNERPGERPISF